MDISLRAVAKRSQRDIDETRYMTRKKWLEANPDKKDTKEYKLFLQRQAAYEKKYPLHAIEADLAFDIDEELAPYEHMSPEEFEKAMKELKEATVAKTKAVYAAVKIGRVQQKEFAERKKLAVKEISAVVIPPKLVKVKKTFETAPAKDPVPSSLAQEASKDISALVEERRKKLAERRLASGAMKIIE